MVRRKRPTLSARLEGAEAIRKQGPLAGAVLGQKPPVRMGREAAEAVLAEANQVDRFPNPVPGDDGEALERITASFKERFPDKWEEWRLCPLQSGLPAMAEELKGKG